MKIDAEYMVTAPLLLGELRSGDRFVFVNVPPLGKDFLRLNSANPPLGKTGTVADIDGFSYNGLVAVRMDGSSEIRHFYCQNSVKKVTEV